MSLSRRQHETITRVLRVHRESVILLPLAEEIIDDLARDLATAFYSESDKFDREKFLIDCGVIT